MKKAIIASLSAYVALLIAVVTMMIVFVAKKLTSSSDKGFFIAITVVFALFVILFALIIFLLTLYPKKLFKEYKVNIEPIIKEHNEKYPNKKGSISIFNEKKVVFISFIMENEERDKYNFILKESPLTKTEVNRLALNVIKDIYASESVKEETKVEGDA